MIPPKLESQSLESRIIRRKQVRQQLIISSVMTLFSVSGCSSPPSTPPPIPAPPQMPTTPTAPGSPTLPKVIPTSSPISSTLEQKLKSIPSTPVTPIPPILPSPSPTIPLQESLGTRSSSSSQISNSPVRPVNQPGKGKIRGRYSSGIGSSYKGTGTGGK